MAGTYIFLQKGRMWHVPRKGHDNVCKFFAIALIIFTWSVQFVKASHAKPLPAGHWDSSICTIGSVSCVRLTGADSPDVDPAPSAADKSGLGRPALTSGFFFLSFFFSDWHCTVVVKIIGFRKLTSDILALLMFCRTQKVSFICPVDIHSYIKLSLTFGQEKHFKLTSKSSLALITYLM